MKPANHPFSCARCHGTGWQDGPPIPGVQEGRPFEYTTVEPCDHHWTTDDPLATDEPIDITEYVERRRL